MATLVQVINSGSSSIKYQLIDLADPSTPIIWASGLVERIGEGDSLLTHQTRIGRGADSETATTQIQASLVDHAAGFQAIAEVFAATGPVEEVGSLAAFGHRVVHGGDAFSAPAIVDDEVLTAIEACIPLAPLHNPANLAGIRGAMAAHPGLPNVAVFDTAFHQTMPPSSYLYAIDAEVAAAHRIRRYGFHGTSHAYVARRAVATSSYRASPPDNHLSTGQRRQRRGNPWRPQLDVDGDDPLEGLVMGTRSGDVDRQSAATWCGRPACLWPKSNRC
jgi:acetate kinase